MTATPTDDAAPLYILSPDMIPAVRGAIDMAVRALAQNQPNRELCGLLHRAASDIAAGADAILAIVEKDADGATGADIRAKRDEIAGAVLRLDQCFDAAERAGWLPARRKIGFQP